MVFGITSAIFAAIFGVLAFADWFLKWRVPRRGKLPPGPPGYPLIGNLPLMLKESNAAKLFMNLSKAYGPVVSLTLPGGHLVAINDHDSIHEALVRNGEFFHHRSDDIVLRLVGRRGILGADGEVWREHRKLLAKIFRESAIGKHGTDSRVLTEAGKIVKFLKESEGVPVDIHESLATATFNIINWVTTGTTESTSNQDLFRHLLQSTDRAFTFTFASAFNYMPWFTLAFHGRRFFQAWKNFKELQKASKNLVLKQPRNSAAADDTSKSDNCIVSAYKTEQGKFPENPLFSDEEIEIVARDIFSAGMETSLYTLEWVLMALAALPDIQAKLYSELENFSETHGEIMYKDKANLRYTEAVVQESLRWGRVVPILAHAAAAGGSETYVEFQKYQIPTGTPVYINLYAALRDPKVWERPEDFQPEHFFDPVSGQLRNLDKNVAFSVGKRSCLGEALARQEIFYLLTQILINFEVVPTTSIDLGAMVGKLGMTWRPPRMKLIYKPRYKANNESTSKLVSGHE